MKPHTDEHKRPTWNRGTVVTTLILAAIGLFLHAGGHPALANLVLFIDAFY